MRVRLGLAIGTDIPMDVDVGDHPAIDEFALDEIARQRDALLLRHLARNGEFDLARELRIFALLSRLDLVPKGRAIGQALGRTFGQHHLAVDDARLIRKVMRGPQPLVVQSLGRTVGGGRYRAPARAARDDLCREMIDRHDGVDLRPEASHVGTTYKRALLRYPPDRFIFLAISKPRDAFWTHLVMPRHKSYAADMGDRKRLHRYAGLGGER